MVSNKWVETHHDVEHDHLYVQRIDAKVHTSKTCATDPYIIFGYNDCKILVAVTIIDAHGLMGMWHRHPARVTLPSDLMAALDIWFWTQTN